MTSPPRIAAAYFTLAGDVLPFENDAPSAYGLGARADAAARVGYVGLGLDSVDLAACVDDLGYPAMRRIFRDAGLDHVEFEVLVDWFACGPRREASDARRALFLEAAAELGAAQIKIIGDTEMGDWPMSLLIDSFGALCRDARRAGTNINIELYPGCAIRDLPMARAIVEGAGEANGAMLIDVWHMARGGIPYEDVAALPARLIGHVELDDAAAEQVGDVFEDTIRRRLLPGEGALDVPRFLRAIRATGFDGTYSVEIVSDAHRALPLDQAAALSYAATLKQFALAEAATPGLQKELHP